MIAHPTRRRYSPPVHEQGRFTLWMVLGSGVHHPWIPASAGMTAAGAGRTAVVGMTAAVAGEHVIPCTLVLAKAGAGRAGSEAPLDVPHRWPESTSFHAPWSSRKQGRDAQAAKRRSTSRTGGRGARHSMHPGPRESGGGDPVIPAQAGIHVGQWHSHRRRRSGPHEITLGARRSGPRTTSPHAHSEPGRGAPAYPAGVGPERFRARIRGRSCRNAVTHSHRGYEPAAGQSPGAPPTRARLRPPGPGGGRRRARPLWPGNGGSPRPTWERDPRSVPLRGNSS